MAKGATLTEATAARVIGTFEDKDIRRTSVEIPGVAGGLQKAMKIDPRVMKQGERGYIALEYVVEKIRHDPIDKDAPAGDQERVHILQVEGSAFIDGALVKQSIETQKEKVRKLDDEKKGRVELPDAGTIPVSATANKAAAKKAAGAKKAPAKAVARGRRTLAK